MKSTSVDDDPADGRTWIKANPSLKESGGFLDKEKIRQQYVSHQAEADLSSFKRYFLNNWGQKERRAIDMNLWRACRRDWDASGWLLSQGVLARFVNRKCWLDLDISMTTDLSALAAVFRGTTGATTCCRSPGCPRRRSPDARCRTRCAPRALGGGRLGRDR